MTHAITMRCGCGSEDFHLSRGGGHQQMIAYQGDQPIMTLGWKGLMPLLLIPKCSRCEPPAISADELLDKAKEANKA